MARTRRNPYSGIYDPARGPLAYRRIRRYWCAHTPYRRRGALCRRSPFARRRAHDRTARRSSLGMRDQHEMRWSRTATGQNKARVSQRASASAFRAHSLSIDAPPHAHLSPDRTEPRRTVRSGRPVRGRTACTRRRGRTKTAWKRTVGRSHGNTGISPTRTKRCALELSHHTSWWCVSRRRAGPLNCADCLRREELQMPVHAVACARGGRVGARRRERW